MASDNVRDVSVEILISIRDELVELRTDMRAGFERIDARFDNLIDTMGGRTRKHEERIEALEERVEKLEKAGGRRRPTGGPRRR